MLGTAADSVADTLESSTRYLQDEGLNRMVEDVSGVVRRNPMACMLCCVGVGFLLGKLLSVPSSSPNFSNLSSRSY